jgi:carnitine O-acetyltransferase
VFYVSYFYQFKDTVEMEQTARAAMYVKGAFKYRELLVTEQLAPEMAGKEPVDMSMYQYLFNAARLPVADADQYVTYDSTFYHHIIVMCGGDAYSLDIVVDGKELSTAEIQEGLAAVVKMAKSGKTNNFVGALTSDNRDSWTDARIELLRSDANAELMQKMDSSVLVVCLDDCLPVTSQERARNLWHGDGINRWYDKPCQFIVAANGQAGFLGEHGMMDGTPTYVMVEWVLNQLKAGTLDHGTRQAGSQMSPPKRMDFQVNDTIKTAIRGAQEQFQGHVKLHDASILEFNEFGKDSIKGFKISPDAFCQMAIQLAYKRLTGGRAATYESCSVRKFLHGRTECIRSCSMESCKWVDSMDDKSLSPAQQYAFLQGAATAQSAFARDCSNAQGVDRHLLGLKV